MLMTTRRRIGAPAWLALGLVVGLPALAEAQLFPNRTLTRQRTACVNEPPFNAHVRRDFYGYYPTCWSKFPDGWACPCPNPELPNAAASFAKRPLDTQSREPGPEMDPGLDINDRPAESDMPGPDSRLPEVPRNRSPFNLDTPPDTTPAPTTPADPAPRPRTPGPGRPTPRPNNDNPGARPTTGLLEMPGLPTPTLVAESRLEPGALALAPEATHASNAGNGDRPDLGPLPSAPTPAASAPMVVEQPPFGASAPAPAAQAPRRRSLIGGLFGGGNRSRR